ncbi:MAG: alpha/beta hydrolase [Anaerolineae bacterium]
MTRTAGVDPGPFTLSGGPAGFLLLHGLTGSPPEMLPLGRFLHERGVTVSAPLLAGHGTTAEELNRVRWQDWGADAEQALSALRRQCEVVFVGGLSMGALVALQLTALHPEVAGLALYAPAIKLANPLLPLLPIARHFVRQWPKEPDTDTDLSDPSALERLWSYESNPTHAVGELLKLQRLVRRQLGSIRTPAIVFHSTRDATLHSAAGRLLVDALGSTDKELVILHNSGHCLTVDSECESVFCRTLGFMIAHAGGLLSTE